MARVIRRKIKQNIDSSIKHIDSVLGYLIQNGEFNRQDHPEILEQYKTIFQYFKEGKEMLEILRKTY